MFDIRQRRLIPAEAVLLAEKIKMTPNITGYSSSEWMSFANVLTADSSDGTLKGVCLCCDFGKIWTYISVLFVFEEYRGQGIGHALFKEACDVSAARKRNIYTSSRNSTVINMMKEEEFSIFDTLYKLPKPYKRYELLFFIRLVKWIASYYRIKEMFRKSKKFKDSYKDSSDFVYGIKTHPKP